MITKSSLLCSICKRFLNFLLTVIMQWSLWRGRSVTGTCRTATRYFLHIFPLLSFHVWYQHFRFFFSMSAQSSHVFPSLPPINLAPSSIFLLWHCLWPHLLTLWNHPLIPQPRPQTALQAVIFFNSSPKSTQGTSAQPGCSRHRADREKEVEKDVHALTYVLSIEIALTVTVLCREASREKRG